MKRRQWTLAVAAVFASGLAGVVTPALARDADDGEFVILQARYGTERNHVDVIGRLRDLARQDRRLRVTNDLFGVDPDPGRRKTLSVTYRWGNEPANTVRINERDTIRLP